jgi:hypothetical protein
MLKRLTTSSDDFPKQLLVVTTEAEYVYCTVHSESLNTVHVNCRLSESGG